MLLRADKHHYACIEWKNGHSSAFHGEWLHDNRYDSVPAVTAIPTVDALKSAAPFVRRAPNGHPPTLVKFDFDAILKQDEDLLDWLEVMVR